MKQLTVTNEEGRRLQLFMERENLTQDEIAEVTGKSQSDISRYIGGKYSIPLAFIKKLHLKYGLNYTYVFHGTGTMKGPAVKSRNIMTDLVDIHAALGVIMASQDEMRSKINTIAKDLYADKHKA